MDNSLDIKKGDLLKVFQKVIEGKKERLQSFTGRVLNVKGSGENAMITVQQIFEGIAVERIYPLSSPVIAKIEKVEEKKKVKAPTRKSSDGRVVQSSKAKTKKTTKKTSKSSKK